MKNWLLSSRIGLSVAEARARFMLCREWSASSRRKRPALVASRTKPCVTRMPLTDSASVAVTRLKLSCEAREKRESRSRKWRFTFQITGARPSTTRNIGQSVQSMTTAAPSICPPCTIETKNTSWMPTRSASMSEVMRPRTRPSFVLWKKAIGCRCTLAKSSPRRRWTTRSPSSCA